MTQEDDDDGPHIADLDVPPELGDLLSRMALPSTPTSAFELSEADLSELESWKKPQAVALIAGMLTDVRFHTHVVRLDWLQRLVVSRANGRKKPKKRDLGSILNQGMGAARIAFMEDEIEGFFVEALPTSRIDGLIFEGHWEGAAQYTETVLRAFERLSDSPIKLDALEKAYALVRLSTALVRRTGLARRSFNKGTPKADLVLPSDDTLQKLARRVRFSRGELSALGIAWRDLQPFILRPSQHEDADDVPPGSSVLDNQPLLEIEDGVVVASPGSMSLALRTFLIDTVVSGGVGRAFVAYLAEIQCDFAVSTGFFPVHDMPFFPLNNFNFRAMVVQFAQGRYLHVVQVLPDLASFAVNGFGGLADLRDGADAAIGVEVARFWDFLSQQSDCRESLTVLLMSGWGGSIAFVPEIDEEAVPPSWEFIAINFADAATMGACDDGKLRDLRRMHDQLSVLAKAGYQVQRVNGSINLFGNWRTTGGNFVPEHWDADPPAFLSLPLDDLFAVRLEGESNRDVRSVARRDGRFEIIQRAEWGEFSAPKPIYGSFDAIAEGRLVGVVAVQDRVWWIGATQENENDAGREWQYQIWNSVMQWLGASAGHLISRFPSQLIVEPSEVRIVIGGDGMPEFDEEAPEGRAEDHLTLRVAADGVHEVLIGSGWVHFLRQLTNDAELALASAAVVQLAAQNGQQLTQIEVSKEIGVAIPSKDWRYLHAHAVKYPTDRLAARGFYPRFRRIPKSAAALVRCGSVWKFWDRAKGHELNGEEECRSFLSSYYDFILSELINQIRPFNRILLVKASASRYAAARQGSDQWKRTIRAMRTIHGSSIDDDALLRFSEFNAVQRASKTICEIAACVAAADGGAEPAQEDLDEMFARALLLFGNGQLFATIRGGLVNPHLKISPAGDLLSDRSVFEKTFIPSSKRANAKALDEASESYAERFNEPVEPSSDKLQWSQEFKDAVSAEYKCSPEAAVDLQVAIIDICVARNSGILVMKRSELVGAITSDEQFPDRNVDGLLDRFSLPRRDDWNAKPSTYSARDLELWRFDRKYSLINRPILQLTSDADPLLLISPMFVSDGTMYQLGGMHFATVHNDDFWESREAKAYAGKRAKQIGAEFEDEVADVLKNAGFDAKPRQKVTGLLQESTDIDFGDVDVFAISFSRSDVFVIEAKNLKLCRTEAEVTARMSDYAGNMVEDSKGKQRPDKLLKHLRRVAYLREKADLLAARLGLPVTPRVHGLMVVDAPQPMNFYMLEEKPDARSCTLDDLVETIQSLAEPV